jgi:hypothetical protein
MILRQRGLGMLVVVLLVLTVAAFAVIVAASQSGGDIQASDANAEALQAMFLAETGLERQVKRFATHGPFNPLAPTAACISLGDDPATIPVEVTHTIADLSTIGLGATAYSITFTSGTLTDFAGGALASTQCRIAVTARVNASNVTRTIHAIVDRNLFDGADNPNFDNPRTAAVAPLGWTGINPVTAFAPNGGPDGTWPNCRRAAWTARNNPVAVGNDRRARANAAVQITLNAGSVTTITVHRRVITRTTDCGAALPAAGPGAAAWPATCGASANDSTVCVRMVGTGGAGDWAAAWHANAAGAGTAACPSTFNPCETSYQAGAPGTKLSANVTMTGAATLTQLQYWLRLQNAGRKELFFDGIEAINPTAVGAAYVKVWRDCSMAANPVTCN